MPSAHNVRTRQERHDKSAVRARVLQVLYYLNG